jgi:putative transposase
MPWKEVSQMEEKLRFASLAESGRFEIVRLCEEFGISRKTGYKWLERYRAQGSAGLKERSRAPRYIPGRTDREVEELIVSERRRHPTWGAKKIAVILERKHGLERVPARSTIGEILKRNGLIEARRRRPGAFSVARGDLQQAERSNQVWACDYKGWFTLGNGERCDPLTLSDQFSRYVIRLEAVAQATQRWTRAGFERAFRAYGLPERIRVDNGSPFASMGPGGLSKLSAWWVTLGIEVEFTPSGSPAGQRTARADASHDEEGMLRASQRQP